MIASRCQRCERADIEDGLDILAIIHPPVDVVDLRRRVLPSGGVHMRFDHVAQRPDEEA